MPQALETKSLSERNNDYIRNIEQQLKDLWFQYVSRLEETGFDEVAKSLKERYFENYRRYRQNRAWRELLNNSLSPECELDEAEVKGLQKSPTWPGER